MRVMTNLDEAVIRGDVPQDVQDRIQNFATFGSIDSTNNYLLQVPEPLPGMMNIAATTNQTAGRGRQGKVWSSPAGAGLCLSVAYTFASHVRNLPALTLALGLAARDALQELGAKGVQLKWPNDLVANDGKLGGILTEVQEQSLDGATIVAGIGVNIDLDDEFVATTQNEWGRGAIDMKSVCEFPPTHDAMAARLVTRFRAAFRDYEKLGFKPLSPLWAKHDWLSGRTIQVETANRHVTGVASGVADDGALLLQAPDSGLQRITSGTIVRVDPRAANQ